MKKEINAFDYAGEICKAMRRGILLTTKKGDFVNTMTIGWGHIGIIWGKPVFIAYVRDSRHTKEMLDSCGAFTVNIPYGEVNSKILGVCGTKSGRDMDKIQELNLHLEDSNVISVPGIKELPLTLECKVIYTQRQDANAIPEDVLSKYYVPEEGVRDIHTCYYGEIVGAYLITD